MLELIFQGFVEWIYGMVLEAWEYFASSLLDIMSMDFSYLEQHIAIIPIIRQSMLAVGWAILLGNLIFQASRSMLSGLGFEGEDPKLLFIRTFVFSFLLLAGPQICDLCLNLTSKVIEVFQMPTAVQITFADESTFAGLAGAWLLVTICGIIVMFQSFKLIMEMAERYFILAMLTISAPLAFGTGGSKSTSDIFSGWCRMYGSMCLLMILNVVFVKMLLSVLSFVPSGLDVLPWMILVITIVKVAKKADGIITRIGLNPAMTGAPLGRSFPGTLTYIVARTAISNATRALGKSGGSSKSGGSGGGSPNNPPAGSGVIGRQTQNGSPRSGTGNSRTSQGGAYSHQAASQNVAQQSSTRQESPKQDSTAQFGGQRDVFSEQTGGMSSTANSQLMQSGVYTGSAPQTRKTAVPAGTRRAPAHMKTPGGVLAGGGSASGKGQAPAMANPSVVRPGAADKRRIDEARNAPAQGSASAFDTAGNKASIGSMTAAQGKAASAVLPGMAGRNTETAYPGASATETTRKTFTGTEPGMNASVDMTGKNAGITITKDTPPRMMQAPPLGNAETIRGGPGISGAAAKTTAGADPGVAGRERGETVHTVAASRKEETVHSGMAEIRYGGNGSVNAPGKSVSPPGSGSVQGADRIAQRRAMENRGVSSSETGKTGIAKPDRAAERSARGMTSVAGGTAGKTAPLSAGSHAVEAQGNSGKVVPAHSERNTEAPRSTGAGPSAGTLRMENRAGTQVTHQGPVNNTMNAKEQNHISVNNPAAKTESPTNAAPAMIPGSSEKERPTVSATRSTLRPASEQPARRVDGSSEKAEGAPSSAPLVQQTPMPDYGMAGKNPAERQTAGETRSSQVENGKPKVPSVSDSPEKAGLQPLRTARQERRAASMEARSGERTKATSVHPGMAGIAPRSEPAVQPAKPNPSAAANRPPSTAGQSAAGNRSPLAAQSAAGQATRASSVPHAADKSGGKKAMSVASVSGQRFSDRSTGKKREGARKTGGKKNGKR